MGKSTIETLRYVCIDFLSKYRVQLSFFLNCEIFKKVNLLSLHLQSNARSEELPGNKNNTDHEAG